MKKLFGCLWVVGILASYIFLPAYLHIWRGWSPGWAVLLGLMSLLSISFFLGSITIYLEKKEKKP